MKKIGIAVFALFSLLVSGCSIDYTSYYGKYGNIYNKDGTLNSEKIEDTVKTYPSDNSVRIAKYGAVYEELESQYEVYASYYSEAHDVLYISYDKISDRKQTIGSKQLAMMDEHAINYFKSDNTRADYNEYLKVVRVYPDYVSSVCHTPGATEEEYGSIEGCANYNQVEASVNLNGLTNIDRFFNPVNTTNGNVVTYIEPKRDTFAHEFGHVSTYYNLILKGEGNYTDYLRLRLGAAFDDIYPSGLPATYDSNMTYKIQPVEILADDYVELFYDTSKKAYNDYYDYTLSYRDLRNSLDNVSDVHKFLKEDNDFYTTIKDYYSNFINNRRVSVTPRIVRATGNVYASPLAVKNGTVLAALSNEKIIAVEEVTIANEVYYRVVLSNYVDEVNVRQDYSSNIGYILKSDCQIEDGEIVYFTRYNGVDMPYSNYLTIDGLVLLPYQDFSYYYKDGTNVVIYDVIDTGFAPHGLTASNFE